MFSINNTNSNALYKAGALQTAILTSANFSIIATDGDGVIQLFNVGAQRMLGYAADEVINRLRPSDMHDPFEVEERAKLLSSELNVSIAPDFNALAYKAALGLEDVYETTYICKDGRRLPMMVSITALRDELGGVIGYLLIGTDNTQRKRAEDDLKRAMQAVVLASNAKSDFISRMSHELRTPLNAILGFAQLIETGEPAPTPVQQRSLDQILKGGWYLLSLINEILDLALVESGQLALSSEPISISEVMQECRTMIEPQAETRSVKMHFAELNLPTFVMADRTRFKQVMINLLMNAIKYNRDGGSVSVDYTAHSGNSLRINIRDTGVGMTPAQVAHLFQPFNRLGKESSAEEGTGIGLVVTKRLIELMGGTIGLQSTVGVGTLFWTELRLTAIPSLDDTGDGVNPASVLSVENLVAPYSVLYVEDNPANLHLVEQIVARRADVHFFSATDAGSGIALARSHQPDVILMDINLPGISGMDAMQILRADPRTAHIPILALSANALPRDIEHALAAGFVDYITKPIRVNTLMRSLDAALLLSQQDRVPTTTTRETKFAKESP